MWRTLKGTHQGSSSGRLKIEEMSRSELVSIVVAASPDKHASEHKIHRALLAHISPELDKLVSQTGKGTGDENLLVLENVEEWTIGKFLEWAYNGEYETVGLIYEKIKSEAEKQKDLFSQEIVSVHGDRGLKKLPQDVACRLKQEPEFLSHAKIYAFACRFRIFKLQIASQLNLQRQLDAIVELTQREYAVGLSNEWPGWQIFDGDLASDFVDLLTYSFANIPCDDYNLPHIRDTINCVLRIIGDDEDVKSISDPVLDYLVRFSAFQWDILQCHRVFTEFFFNNDTDVLFRLTFASNLGCPNTAPSKSFMSPRELEERHPLNRLCMGCRRTGIPIIKCSTCYFEDIELSMTRAFTKEYEGMVKARLRYLPTATSNEADPNPTYAPDPRGPVQYKCPMTKKTCSAAGDWQVLDLSLFCCKFCGVEHVVKWEFDDNMRAIPKQQEC